MPATPSTATVLPPLANSAEARSTGTETKSKTPKSRASPVTSVAPKPNLKLVIRGLPRDLPEDVFRKSLGQFSSAVSYFRYDQGLLLSESTSRAYLYIKEIPTLLSFITKYNGHEFRRVDANGQESVHRAIVEWAPYQKIPKERARKDVRVDTIDRDPAFKAFRNALGVSTEDLLGKVIVRKRDIASMSALNPSSDAQANADANAGGRTADTGSSNATGKQEQLTIDNYLDSLSKAHPNNMSGEHDSTPLLDYIRAKKRNRDLRLSLLRAKEKREPNRLFEKSSPRAKSRHGKGDRERGTTPLPSTPKILRRRDKDQEAGASGADNENVPDAQLTTGTSTHTPAVPTDTKAADQAVPSSHSSRPKAAGRPKRRPRAHPSGLEKSEGAPVGEGHKAQPRHERGKAPASSRPTDAPVEKSVPERRETPTRGHGAAVWRGRGRSQRGSSRGRGRGSAGAARGSAPDGREKG